MSKKLTCLITSKISLLRPTLSLKSGLIILKIPKKKLLRRILPKDSFLKSLVKFQVEVTIELISCSSRYQRRTKT